MAYPNFSELTFGYCFLREFENVLGTLSPLPAAPIFLTAAQEAFWGADVAFIPPPPNFIPIFIQLKRSEVMTRLSANEFKSGHFSHSQKPVYRMHLHKDRQFHQHRALQVLEQLFGSYVFYATSQIPNKSVLDQSYINGKVISEATAFFSPLRIQLPNFSGSHHISYTKDALHSRIYSDEGNLFERKHPISMIVVERLKEESRGRERKHQTSDLKKAEEIMMKRIPEKLNFRIPPYVSEFLSEYDDLEKRVAILAHFLLDARLCFAGTTAPKIKPPS